MNDAKHALRRVRRNEYQYGPLGGPTATIKVSAKPGSAHVKLLKHRMIFNGKTMAAALNLALRWIDVEVERVNSSKPGAGS